MRLFADSSLDVFERTTGERHSLVLACKQDRHMPRFVFKIGKQALGSLGTDRMNRPIHRKPGNARDSSDRPSRMTGNCNFQILRGNYRLIMGVTINLLGHDRQ